MAKKTKKHVVKKSAVQRALDEKRACVDGLEKAVSTVKFLRGHKVSWAKAVKRGKPVQIREFLDGFHFMYGGFPTSATSAWNALALSNPKACIEFHAAAMAAIDAGIAQSQKDAERLAKAPCK